MLIGSILRHHYRVVKLLGSGGFGDTYLAEDLDLPDRPLRVVKHLKPKDPNPAVLPIAKRLFDNEAKTLYQLGNSCDQIPKLFAHFSEGNEFYLVQEFIDGHDLSQEIVPGRPWSEAATIDLLRQILKVLAVVHRHNVIHRDIKPQNIMRRERDGRLMLIDFGAVKEISNITVNSQGQSRITIAIGTPGYSPSEQAAGHPQLCSDVHAVGMLSIQALTGVSPEFLPKDPRSLEVIWRDRVQVSDAFANVLTQMVRYHFDQRYQNAEEALQALQALTLSSSSPHLPSQPPSSFPSPYTPTLPSHPPASPERWSRRKLIQTAGLAVFGAGAAMGINKFLEQRTNKVSQTPITSPEPVNTPVPDSPLPEPVNISSGINTFETVMVNDRGEIIDRRPGQARLFAEDLGNGVMLEMVEIPEGKFLMGSLTDEPGRSESESPQHEVTVPAFFMGKFEVTQAQYEEIVGSNPSNLKGDKRPVEQVSWNDAVEFCRRLSEKTGRQYRLPSEAQWEYACRAGTTTPFYFGATITTDLANYDGSNRLLGGQPIYRSEPQGQYREQTTDVGSFPPNAFGLYDMHANLWEWCEDIWHENYNNAPTDGSAWVTGGSDSLRIVRGGSWDYNPRACRSAYRGYNPSDTRYNILGFRVVCVATDAVLKRLPQCQRTGFQMVCVLP